ncbi:MAG: dihydrofolate reductase family protein [Phototrophicales bacterium]|nr:dihydrofolate reductase family protein [Phototrophicales bacterium]
MTKIVLYIAISLDGYIATEDGSVAWLDGFNIPNEDYGYQTMYDRMGAVVMGGITYRQVLGFSTEWVYVGKKSYILTRQPLDNPPDPAIYAFNGDVRDLVTKLQVEHSKDIWLVGGGDVVAQFMAHNLIDEYHLSVMPVLLGRGIRLFNGVDLSQSQTMKLDSVKSYPNGVVQMIYITNPPVA